MASGVQHVGYSRSWALNCAEGTGRWTLRPWFTRDIRPYGTRLQDWTRKGREERWGGGGRRRRYLLPVTPVLGHHLPEGLQDFDAQTLLVLLQQLLGVLDQPVQKKGKEGVRITSWRCPDDVLFNACWPSSDLILSFSQKGAWLIGSLVSGNNCFWLSLADSVFNQIAQLSG